MPGADHATAADATSRLIGGHLALDFSNTVGWRLRNSRDDRLATYDALVGWARAADVLGPSPAKRLWRIASQRPREARTALRRARVLREAIFDIGAALDRGRVPSDAALTAIHAARIEALRGGRLSWTDNRCAMTWDAAEHDLDRPWWPVAVAAAELLESNELHRVRLCAGEGCGWLFLDQSRNSSRRWCVSGDCGNRARVDQFRARQRRAARQRGRR